MTNKNELPFISLENLLELLIKLNIKFLLAKENKIVSANPSDLNFSSITKESFKEYNLIDGFSLFLKSEKTLLLEEKVRNARHDIYNLINTSLLGLDYVKSKFSLHNDIHRCEVIERNLNSVTKLLETVFHESKEKARVKFSLNKTLIDLARIFSTAISINKSFSYSICESEFYIDGIKENIFSAVLNLLINADEATDEEGSIKLILEVNDESANIIVEDNGKGIHEQNIKKIFDQGFSTKSKKRDSGIGLFNVKEIVCDHNGSIEVESNSKFTRFTIIFRNSYNYTNPEKLKTILFADDDEMLLELIYDLLSSYDFKIITVNNGMELINKFNDKIDLIIADKNMPMLDGISAVKRIREINNAIPVIISTGLAKDDTEKDELQGYNNIYFIDKPYNFEKLLNLINSI